MTSVYYPFFPYEYDNLIGTKTLFMNIKERNTDDFKWILFTLIDFIKKTILIKTRKK